ncbi:MAG: hypothetical protein ACPGO3_11105 [Magnetospiraceae bacterium]
MEPISAGAGSTLAVLQTLRQTAQQDVNQTAQVQRLEEESEDVSNRLDETENRGEVQQGEESSSPSPYDSFRGQNLDITV